MASRIRTSSARLVQVASFRVWKSKWPARKVSSCMLGFSCFWNWFGKTWAKHVKMFKSNSKDLWLENMQRHSVRDLGVDYQTISIGELEPTVASTCSPEWFPLAYTPGSLVSKEYWFNCAMRQLLNVKIAKGMKKCRNLSQCERDRWRICNQGIVMAESIKIINVCIARNPRERVHKRKLLLQNDEPA